MPTVACNNPYISRNHHAASGSPGSSRERERIKSKRSKISVKRKRILRSALEKAGEVALRLTLEVSAGVKAFDGPPLKPSDVKDLFLRNFRVRLSTSEAEALIMHFTSSTTKVGGGSARSQSVAEYSARTRPTIMSIPVFTDAIVLFTVTQSLIHVCCLSCVRCWLCCQNRFVNYGRSSPFLHPKWPT